MKVFTFNDIENGVIFDMAGSGLKLISGRKKWHLNFMTNNYRIHEVQYELPDREDTYDSIMIKWEDTKLISEHPTSFKDILILVSQRNEVVGYKFILGRKPKYENYDEVRSYGLLQPFTTGGGYYNLMYNLYTHPSAPNEEGILFTVPQDETKFGGWARFLYDEGKRFPDAKYYDKIDHLQDSLKLGSGYKTTYLS